MLNTTLKAAALLLACFALCSTAQATPPKVLIVVIDDAGYADFTGGNAAFHLPNLEAFAATSVRCTRGYAPASICSQSRCGMLTGRTPQSIGYWQLDESLHANVPILPELVADTHRTYAIGKWHHDTGFPLTRGWEHSFGFRAATRWYVPYPGTSSTVTNSMYAAGTGNQHFVNQHLERDGAAVFPEPSGHLTDWLADEALAVMQSSGSQPWLIWFAPLAVHGPNHKFHTHPDYYALAPGVVNTPQKAYRAQALHLDARLGDLIAEAESQDALILITADNGGAVVYGADNSPLIGGKEEHVEGGVRVPVFWKWGSRFPARSYSPCVSGIDLLPTILAASSLPTPAEVQGVNLLPYLDGSLGNQQPHTYLEWDRTLTNAPYTQPRMVLQCETGLKFTDSNPGSLANSQNESVAVPFGSGSQVLDLLTHEE